MAQRFMGTRIDLLVTAVAMPGSTKRQAEALAQAHTRIHKLVAVVKAKVATRTAEADQAAQAQIDAITTQSHHRVTTLTHKAMDWKALSRRKMR
jgi:hypothetical protein